MKHSKKKEYQRIVWSAKWQRLRDMYKAQHPVCEMCEKNGRTSLAKVVHHIVPIEDARDVVMMESLAYDWNNLMALCEDCHEQIHYKLGSRFKAGKKAKRAEAKRVAAEFLKQWCKQS